jgi:hypothetical protein
MIRNINGSKDALIAYVQELVMLPNNNAVLVDIYISYSLFHYCNIRFYNGTYEIGKQVQTMEVEDQDVTKNSEVIFNNICINYINFKKDVRNLIVNTFNNTFTAEGQDRRR